MHVRLNLLTTFICFVPLLAHAELERVQLPCGGVTCVHFLPKLPSLTGWHIDSEPTSDSGVVALVPDGSTYANAEYIIYARALQKSLLMDQPSLTGFIAQDKDDYQALYPGIKVQEEKPVQTAQEALRTLRYTPTKSGHWEQVTYHEDGNHFVVIVLTSKTSAGYSKALNQYLDLLKRY